MSRRSRNFPIEKWDAIIAINLSSAFHTIRAGAAGMKRAQGWGRIINVASAHALVASPFKSAYVAAKHGVLGLTKRSALESRRARHHRATPSAPAMCCTPLVEKQIDDQAKARGITARAGHQRRAAGRAADQALRRPSTRSPRWRCSLHGERPPRSPARHCRSTAAGPPIEARWPIAGSRTTSTRSASARRSTSRRCSCNETGRRPECTTEGMMHRASKRRSVPAKSEVEVTT